MRLKTALRGHNRQIAALLIELQFTEHLQLPPGDFTGGVKRFIGRTFTGGIELGTAPAHQVQKSRPATRLLKGRHDHKQRPILLARQRTGHKSPGPPTTSAEQEPVGAIDAFAELTGQR
ncbi:MAG: Uncharacterised protein [Synechococcus sp. MIT S9220]|nr:MAG: Uncharacterised protein [Synechococcus sp. MIT S9220]